MTIYSFFKQVLPRIQKLNTYLAVSLLLGISSVPARSASFFDSREIELNGFLQNEVQFFIRDDNRVLKNSNWLNIRLRQRLIEGGIFSDVDIRHDETAGIGSPALVNLNEAYLSWVKKGFNLRLGRQIISWGQTDEFNVVDFVNPEDYTEFLLQDKHTRKIGTTLINLSYHLGRTSFQTVYIPVFKPSIIPQNPEYSVWVPRAVSRLQDLDEDGEINLEEPEFPRNILESGEYGIKIATLLNGTDLGFMFFSGYPDMPVYFQAVDMVDQTWVFNITPSYRRYNRWGVEFARFIGDFGLRGECAYHQGRYYSYDFENAPLQEGAVRKDNFEYILGMDYDYWDIYYFNVQFHHSTILDYENVINVPRYESRIMGNASWQSERSDIETGGWYVYNIDHGDWLLNLYCSIPLTDILELELGVFVLEGNPDTMFGQFAGNDVVYSRATFNF